MHKEEKRLYQISNGKNWTSASQVMLLNWIQKRIIGSYFKKDFLKENLLHADQKL